MNRKQFIKTSILSGITLSILPHLAFQNATIPYKELIGKGNPSLYGEGYQLRTEAYDAFIKMKKVASIDGISIQVVSSYRNFDHQNRIWTRKYNNYTSQGLTPEKSIEKIIEYSTIPGTSRHHWGTDMDIIDGNVKQPSNVLIPSHFETNGCFAKFKSWMDEHANRFGFYLVYTNDPNRKGFKYEPWHYSYKPLSYQFLSIYKKLNLSKILKDEKLLGSDHFSDQFLTTYRNENILDINPELL